MHMYTIIYIYIYIYTCIYRHLVVVKNVEKSITRKHKKLVGVAQGKRAYVWMKNNGGHWFSV